MKTSTTRTSRVNAPSCDVLSTYVAGIQVSATPTQQEASGQAPKAAGLGSHTGSLITI